MKIAPGRRGGRLHAGDGDHAAARPAGVMLGVPVADVAYVGLTLVCFALLGAIVRGVERL